MSGICLCQYKECPKSKGCLRYLGSLRPEKHSSYADFKNICKEENEFKYFWENNKKDEVKK